MYLSDLDGGQLPAKGTHSDLEGQLVMRLAFLPSDCIFLCCISNPVRLRNNIRAISFCYVCRGTMDELRWWHISHLSEHFTTGFHFLAVMSRHIFLVSNYVIELFPCQWLLKVKLIVHRSASSLQVLPANFLLLSVVSAWFLYSLYLFELWDSVLIFFQLLGREVD